MTFAVRSRVYNHVVSELWLVVGSRSSPWSVVLEVTFWNRVKSIEVYVGIGTASKARPKHSAAPDDGIPSHICFHCKQKGGHRVVKRVIRRVADRERPPYGHFPSSRLGRKRAATLRPLCQIISATAKNRR